MNCIRFEIGSRIRRLRIRRGLSQEKLAELADLNTSYIGQIERGEKNPSIETVYKISQAMDTDISELFKNLMSTPGGMKDKYPQTVYSLMLDLDEKYCKCVLDIVTALRNCTN